MTNNIEEFFVSYSSDLFEIEITYNPNWTDLNLLLVEQCLNSVLKILPFEIKNFFSLSVLLTNDHDVHAYNKQYRNKDKPTNVLSFQGYQNANELIKLKNIDEPVLLGDLVFGYETILREIDEKNSIASEMTNLNQYFCILCIHGLLHLFGFHHETDAEEELMNNMAAKAYTLVDFNKNSTSS